MFDEIHEECGVFGAYHIQNAAAITYYGLHTLQHRGQEASGIAVGEGAKIQVRKGKGLTIDVFTREKTRAKCPGRWRSAMCATARRADRKTPTSSPSWPEAASMT